MKTKSTRAAALLALAVFAVFAAYFFTPGIETNGLAQNASASPSPTPAAQQFDQAAALAKLREQIKGRENEPAPAVFKNLQTPFLKGSNAGRVLAVMNIAYSQSLGVNCTHCHIPDKWDSDEKENKQIARDMAAMMAKINGELLKNIKNLSQNPTINCTTCHRGQVKPALNLPPPPKT